MGNHNYLNMCYKREEQKSESLKIFKSFYCEDDNSPGILIYDTGSERVERRSLLSSILTNLNGVTELFYDNELYFSGGTEYFLGSTYFLKYNYNSGLKILVNSNYSHKNPHLVGINEYIYCLGGLEDNRRCERYHLNEQRWESILDLPFSRSQCSSYYSRLDSYLYLIGGFSYLTGKMIDSIIRIKVADRILGYNWEEIRFSNLNLIQKSHMGVVSLDDENVLILGGYVSEDEKDSNEILKINFRTKNIVKSETKLKFKSNFEFNAIYVFENDRKLIFLIDSENNIIKLNENGKVLSIKPLYY